MRVIFRGSQNVFGEADIGTINVSGEINFSRGGQKTTGASRNQSSVAASGDRSSKVSSSSHL